MKFRFNCGMQVYGSSVKFGSGMPSHLPHPPARTDLAPPRCPALRITTLYTGNFGVPQVGTKIFVRCNQMIDGYEDIPHRFQAIVPAAS
jgi:hypothetical protein